jgi:hypothetical protein
MKKRVVALVLVALISLAFFLFFASADSINVTMQVGANILASPPPPQILRVSIPDYVFLGNVTKGQETERVKVYVNNTGTINATLTPILIDSSNQFFQNLYFTRRLAESYKKIGDFNFALPAHSPTGGIEEDYFYMKLDLKNFTASIPQTLLNQRADIKFLVVSQ